MRVTVAAVLVALLAACGVPSLARTGHTLKPGEFQFGATLGGTFGSEKMPDAAMETVSNVGLAMRAGVIDGCDATAQLSVMRLGAHARCSVLSEHRGAPLSITPGVGFAWLPRRGPEYVASLDLGKGAEWPFAPLVNLEVSRGTYFHFERYSDEELLGRHIEQSKYRTLTRDETRVRTTLGFGIHVPPSDPFDDGGGPALSLGVSPYWIVAGAPTPVDLKPDGVTWIFAGGFQL